MGTPDRSAARSNRLLAFGGLLVLCSPGVLLGWGFSVGMVAGCAISYGLEGRMSVETLTEFGRLGNGMRNALWASHYVLTNERELWVCHEH